MAVYCRNCGASMAEEVRFCSACGAAAPVHSGPVQGAPFAGTAMSGMIRPRAGRVIGGVCQGLANQYRWDPIWVRVVTVLLAVFGGGLGAVAYVVLWVMVPEEPYLLPPGGPASPTYRPQPPYSTTGSGTTSGS